MSMGFYIPFLWGSEVLITGYFGPYCNSMDDIYLMFPVFRLFDIGVLQLWPEIPVISTEITSYNPIHGMYNP
jgi:hypothetical protein